MASQLIIVIPFKTAHDSAKQQHKLLGRNHGITVVIEGLKVIDHTSAHGIEPQSFVFL